MSNNNELRSLVKSYISSFPGKTAKEIKRLMEEDKYIHEDSSVGGRISELKALGEVVEAGKKRCSRTGHMAAFYEATNELNSHLIQLKTNELDMEIGTLFLNYLNNLEVSRLEKAKLLDLIKLKIIAYNCVNLQEVPFKKGGE